MYSFHPSFVLHILPIGKYVTIFLLWVFFIGYCDRILFSPVYFSSLLVPTLFVVYSLLSVEWSFYHTHVPSPLEPTLITVSRFHIHPLFPKDVILLYKDSKRWAPSYPSARPYFQRESSLTGSWEHYTRREVLINYQPVHLSLRTALNGRYCFCCFGFTWIYADAKNKKNNRGRKN